MLDRVRYAPVGSPIEDVSRACLGHNPVANRCRQRLGT